METQSEMILRVVSEEGLPKAMGYFSAFVNSSPKKKIRTNVYNTYTPKGQGMTHNPNYKSQLVEWKNTKLFPFFLGLGFNKTELNEAWKVSVFKK
jgi:hypothetical protein